MEGAISSDPSLQIQRTSRQEPQMAVRGGKEGSKKSGMDRQSGRRVARLLDMLVLKKSIRTEKGGIRGRTKKTFNACYLTF